MVTLVRRAVLGLLLGVSLMPSVARSEVGDGGSWADKVDPWVLESGASGPTEFLVVLREQADLSRAADQPTRQARGELVSHLLRDTALRSQAPVLAALAGLRVEFRPFWIANMIWVRGDLAVVEAMAERDDVRRVSANPSVKLKTVPDEPGGAPGAPDAVEWGITKTGAPSVWALGYRGAGVVVAGQDTGYQWDHPALRGKYRGWSGSAATHDYNWHDSIHSGGGVCGPNATAPCDDDSHGTHTMGTMIGDDGGSNQIGMAPDAKWIGCRNMNQGVGTPATYSECFQWFVAPTTVAGINPDPSKAPDVINNSWGCPPSEGCTDPMVLKSVVDNTRAAGIVVVVSAGNSGSSCESITDPPAIYDTAFTVGATSSTDSIASFSSRGPVVVGEFSRVEPDVSAPGVSVRSSVPGNSYGTMSGTSMAGPHVAGQVALLLSAMPAWQGDVGAVESRIKQTAVPRTSTQTCGDVPGSQIPNNTFGWGRIDALAAVSMADIGVQLADAPDPVAVGGTLTYTVTVSNAGPVAASGVAATVALPGTVAFVSASTGCSHSAGTVTCTIGTLAKAGSSEKSVVVTVNGAGPITTSATVTGTLHDPVTANNQASATTGTAGGTAALVVQLAGSGSGSVTSSPAGIVCPTTCDASFPLGQGVVLHAVADAGSSFVGFTGEGCAGTGDCSVTMDQSRNVTATFDGPAGADTPAIYRAGDRQWYLRNSNSGGAADLVFPYGDPSDQAVKGDWDGDGDDTVGIYRGGVFYLKNTNAAGNADLVVGFGEAGDVPVAGDWDGDGVDTIGVYRPATAGWLLRNSNSVGAPDLSFTYGLVGETPVVGDWDGNGTDTVGIFRASDRQWYLRNANSDGNAELVFPYGDPAIDIPVVGDWDGDGDDTVGIYRAALGEWFLKNTNEAGFADLNFTYGLVNEKPLAGDWDGN